MTEATPIRQKSGRWVKGSSGNPGGRTALPAEVRAAIQSNGEKAVARMNQMLSDDTAWGKDGWLDQKVQARLLEVAQSRAYGQQVALDLRDGSGGQPGAGLAMSGLLRDVYKQLKADGALPELKNARAVSQHMV
jgi:hypothetical protein